MKTDPAVPCSFEFSGISLLLTQDDARRAKKREEQITFSFHFSFLFIYNRVKLSILYIVLHTAL